jgi:hypothetical protein
LFNSGYPKGKKFLKLQYRYLNSLRK